MLLDQWLDLVKWSIKMSETCYFTVMLMLLNLSHFIISPHFLPSVYVNNTNNTKLLMGIIGSHARILYTI